MKRIISLLIAIVFLLNTSLAYTVTIIVDGVRLSITRDVDQVVDLRAKLGEMQGWKVKSGGVTIENDQFLMPASDVLIEAILPTYKYMLTVENFGAISDSLKLADSEVVATATETAEQRFTGWTVEGINLTPQEKAGQTITFSMPYNEVTLTANYEEGTAATYSVNATTNPVGAGSISGTGNKTAGETVTLTASANAGYIFEGWEVVNGQIEVNNPTSNEITFIMPASNVELVANYSINQYIVTYDANGGENEPEAQRKYHGTPLVITRNTPSKDGVTFKGWGTSPDDTIPTYYPGDEYITEGSITLYAIYGIISVGDYVYYPVNRENTTGSFAMSNLFVEGATPVFRVLEVTNSNVVIFPDSTSEIFSLSLNGLAGYNAGIPTINAICGLYATEYSSDTASVTASQLLAASSVTNLTNFCKLSYWRTTGWEQRSDPSYGNNVGSPWGWGGIISNCTEASSGNLYEGQDLDNGYVRTNYVLPAITLDENVELVGTGTIDDPYVLVLSKEYTVTYNANAGEDIVENIPDIQQKTEGIDLTLRNATPTRDYYIFKGWSTSNSDTTVEYLPGATYAIDADITLYAVWENIIYTVGVGEYIQHIPTADSANARTTYTGHSEEQTLTIDKNEATRMKYKIYANNNGQLDIISAESVGNITLSGKAGYQYGIFELNRVCEKYVNDYADNAVCLGSTRNWVSGAITTYDSNSKTKTAGRISGSTTNGWPLTYEKAYNKTSSFPYVDTLYTTTLPLSDSKLIESLRHTTGTVWVANRYLYVATDNYVNFNSRYLGSNGSFTGIKLYRAYSDTSTSAKTYSETRGVRPVVYLKPGLLIVDGTGTADDPYIVDFNRSVYRITYKANSGDGAPITQLKTPGAPLTLTTTKPTRVGYTFTGWNTQSDGTGTAYAAGATFEVDAHTTLYAQWETATYTIKYNANGGSGTVPATQTKADDVNVTLATNKLTRSGWTFYRWNTKADGTGTNYNSGATYTKNASVTLYAIWVKIDEGPYEASFWEHRSNDNPVEETVTHTVSVTGVSKIKFTCATSGMGQKNTGYLKITCGNTEIFKKTNSNAEGTFTVDVSEYTGNAKFTMYVYAVPDSTYYWAQCVVKITNIICYASPAT